MRRALVIAGTVLAFACVPAGASATIYCVNSPPGCVGTNVAAVQTALDDAAATAAADTIFIDSGTFSGGPFTYAPGIDAGALTINGQGDATILTAPDADNATVLTITPDTSGSPTTVQFLRFRVPSGANTTGLDDTDGDVNSITAVRKTPIVAGTYANGVTLEGAAHLDSSQITMAPDPGHTPVQQAVHIPAGATNVRVTDSFLDADQPVLLGDGQAILRRDFIDGGELGTVCGNLAIDNSIIRTTGSGIDVSSSTCADHVATLEMNESDLVSTTGAGNALELEADGAQSQAFAYLRSTIVWGFTSTALIAGSSGGTARLEAFDSIVDLNAVTKLGPFATAANAGGVFFTDPHFAPTDYSLLGDSPAIDKGAPDSLDPATESTTDYPGNTRVLDGDGDGTARRDIGAFEFTGPHARIAAPPVASTGETVHFDGSGSTSPQGRTLTYAWSLDDGTTGTGATLDHAFAAAGTHTATLTVTDNQSLASTATATVTVTDPPSSTPPAQAPVVVTNTVTGPPDPAKVCKVPKLTGLTLAKAKSKLKSAHCKLGKQTKKSGSKKNVGKVVAQNPKSGRTLASGASIDVTVGKAKKKRKH